MSLSTKEEYARGIAERIRPVLEIRGLRPYNLSVDLGEAPNSVNAWCKGDRPQPAHFLYNLCLNYHINIEWLMTGYGEPTARNLPEFQDELDKVIEYIRETDVATDLIIDEIRKNEHVFREVVGIGISRITGLLDKIRTLIIADEIKKEYGGKDS